MDETILDLGTIVNYERRRDLGESYSVPMGGVALCVDSWLYSESIPGEDSRGETVLDSPLRVPFFRPNNPGSGGLISWVLEAALVKQDFRFRSVVLT